MYTITLWILILMQSCVTKKHILYVQDDYEYLPLELSYNDNTIQVDDVLDIRVGALTPEAALPFNRSLSGKQVQNNNVEIMKLEGYLVTQDKTINFPILGVISVAGKTITTLEKDLKERLESGGYLIDPSVTIRLLNAKVTILGEVRTPGTYTFTENNMSFLQALGMAGDLTINANREELQIIRSVDGVLTTGYLNLTSAKWLSSPFERIKPNDVIIVQPNKSKIKSASFIGNAGSFVSIASLIISTIVLINNL